MGGPTRFLGSWTVALDLAGKVGIFADKVGDKWSMDNSLCSRLEAPWALLLMTQALPLLPLLPAFCTPLPAFDKLFSIQDQVCVGSQLPPATD